MDDESPSNEFVWRFRLDERKRQAVYDNPLLELTRSQWEQLLKLTIPMDGDRPVRVDGFALMRSPDKVHPVFSDDPRIETEPAD